jgi:predicted membrane-bound mannosyltransferase/DNA-binding beta-propeller fold protein YncE
MEQSFLDRPLGNLVKWNWEKTLYLILIVLALATRVWDLGDRVQSHDESIHTKYSWNLYAGHGFQHNPLMHGPFLFEATAVSYFLFGDNDLTARLPVALMGAALVAFPYLLRRWLGRAGALVASFFLLISPSIAYYSRYIRHDVPIILWSLIVILAILSYLHNGRKRWLYLMAAGISLMFATKEVAFIYNAIFGFFLVGLFALQALGRPWQNEDLKSTFMFSLAIVAVGLLVLGVGMGFTRPVEEGASPPVPPLWAIIGGTLASLALLAAVVCFLIGHLRPNDLKPSPLARGAIIVVVVAGLINLALLRWGLPLTLQSFREFELPGRVGFVLALMPFAGGILVWVAWLATRAFRDFIEFDLIIVLGTLCLPFLSPVLINLAGLDPIDYNAPAICYSGAITGVVFLVSVAIGVVWDWRKWSVAAAIHYAIFIILFTTIFTNGTGIASGMVGSLGYWLAQQAVERGSQPWYYYGIMVPIYEYLPLLLTLIAPTYLAIRSKISSSRRNSRFVPFVLWWVGVSWIGYSYAGEKMPWLTVHLALPMILLSGWLVGQWIKQMDWKRVLQRRAWLPALVTLPFIMATGMLINAIATGPFQGYDLAQLDTTGQLLSGLVGVSVFGAGLVYLLRHSDWRLAVRVLLFVLLLVPVFLTMRTAWRFCYINYDYPTEFLVYAHSGPAVGETMREIEEISRRTVNAPHLIKVAYGADGSTLFYWQLRNYPNAVHYGTTPSREQMDAPIVIAGRDEWDEVAPYMGDDYLVNTYTFLWWPIEDYKDLTWTRITNAITDTQMRAALWDIWYDRDYRRYGELTGKKYTLDEWPLRSDYRLYIRRDVAAQMWNLGATGPVEIGQTDPYAEGWRDIAARRVFGSQGANPGQLQSPRGIKVSPDGYVYVADAGNHRVQKFTAAGQFVAAWGQQSTVEMETGTARGFNEPWGVAVAPDGSIYVADTWNHRIQKLDADGQFVTAWGLFGEYTPRDTIGQGAFYGPRSVAIHPEDGRVYVTDTGNKRVQVFEPDGQFAFQWGGGGVLDGYLDEPVGIAIGPEGAVYVADTWNRRIQVFDSGGAFLRQWPISSWETGSPEEKPYLAVDSQGHVYVTDPSNYRVLVFDGYGDYLLSFGQYGFDEHSFAFPLGIAVASEADDSIYVTDAHSGRVLVFAPFDLSEYVE